MTISVYTGSQVWEGRPKIGPSQKGRVEYGPGIYFTTSRTTAQKYGKGSRTILRVELDPSLTWLEDAIVPTETLVYWVGTRRGLRKKQQIIDDIVRNADRSAARIGKGASRADVLVNLMVNHEALTGGHGPALAEFLVSLGISASHVRHGDEDWIVLFDPSKVVSWRRIAEGGDPWELPRVKRTSRPA